MVAPGNRVPGIAVLLLLARIGRDSPAQLGFGALLVSNQRRFFQSLIFAANCFQAVFNAEKILVCATFLLRPLRAVLLQHRVLAIEKFQQERETKVAQVFEMRDRVHPLSAAGISGNENQFTRTRSAC